MLYLILVQLVEDIPLHANPGAVGKVVVYCFFPERNREAIDCFLRPGYLADLYIACLSLIKDGSTEQEGRRNFTFFESIEVLRTDHLKVIGARDRQIN